MASVIVVLADGQRVRLDGLGRVVRVEVGDMVWSVERVPGPPPSAEVLDTPVREADRLSIRARNCMENAGMHTAGSIAAKSAAELLRSKNVGRKVVDELREWLAELGLHLRGEGGGTGPMPAQ